MQLTLSYRLACSVAATLLVAPNLGHAQSSRTVEINLDTVTFAPSLAVDLLASKRVVRGLYSRDVTVGSGPLARREAKLTVRYVGSLADGTTFTEPSEPPATFTLGAGTVIQGWERGVSGMREGGRRQLIIAPALGYGGRPTGRIPPNSVLVFDVELVSVR
ncbi:MAG TPA: FKBP-type peptidyl-prolyl cis-trans isomerase [Gemmatimonadaceae bacterium]|nr:FKBP-type peptidyl-prolyl cis-trans isomerase [Gemmatimonadaceae bacterium]